MQWLKDKFENKHPYLETLLFIIISVLFVYMLTKTTVWGDDLYHLKKADGSSIAKLLKNAHHDYFKWSSRILINTILYFLIEHRTLWLFFMGISAFVYMKALSLLTGSHKSLESGLFISCCAILVPWFILATAGWISTLCTYYTPIAFGMMSLVPIRKALDHESIPTAHKVFYALCLIYGANNEMFIIVQGLCYACMIAYLFMKKEKIGFLWIQFGLLIASLLFIVTCPGNYVRKTDEIATWFPNYKILHFTNKLELGMSTTTHWIFFSNLACMIFAVIILLVLTFARYKDMLYRLIVIIPLIVLLAGGVLADTVCKYFPYFKNLTAKIPYYGLTSANSYGNQTHMVIYMTLGICAILFLLSFLITTTQMRDVLWILCFLGSGFLSRVMLAFSPTLYASQERTYAILIYMILTSVAYIYLSNLEKIKQKYVVRVSLFVVAGIYLIYSFHDLWLAIFSVASK